jgi:Ca-activated chloride channel family protein
MPDANSCEVIASEVRMKLRWTLSVCWLLAMGCSRGPATVDWQGGPAPSTEISGPVPGAGTSPNGAPGAGATTGGAQDLGLARSKVDQGVLPDPEDFPAEGLYSEHDLPVPAAAPCAQTFCVNAATALVPGLTGSANEVYVQLGLSSGIDLAQFKRRPLNLAVVIDHSGSMGVEKMEAVKSGVLKLIDLLGPDDLLTLVKFDSVATHLIGPQAVTDREPFKAQVREIQSNASTCIECGLRTGFQKLHTRHAATRDSRVILLTDALPNVGATGEGEFTELVDAEAQQGFFLTTFGIGLDFGQALVTRISAIRGANYVFLKDDEPDTAFDEDFDLLVTPLAHDLQLELAPGEGFGLGSLHGIPGNGTSGARAQVKSVFLSRRRSAIVARLTPPDPVSSARAATVALSFSPISGEPVTQTLEADLPAGEAPVYSGPAVRKTVALTRLAAIARKSVELHRAGKRSEAIALAGQLAQYLRAEALALADPALDREANFAEKLATLIARP